MRTNLRMSGKNRIFAGGKNRTRSIRRSQFIKSSRWGQYQQPGDSLLHIYHYIPTGRAYFKSFIHSIGSLSCLFVFLARNTNRSKNYSGSIWINFQRTKNIL